MGKYAKYSKKYNPDWEKLPCFSSKYNNILVKLGENYFLYTSQIKYLPT